ncbi:hypothetical protein MUO79_05630 [Candidatus Bathyarchaeota archaeon]|nr:hypothetical protein [Candidatus Bathyarchaeota archaeon]
MHTATETKTVAGISSLDQQTLKGKLLEFEFYMQKQGYSEATVKHRVIRLSMLARRGANLQDPESVKTTIALQKTWCDGTKRRTRAKNKVEPISSLRANAVMNPIDFMRTI